MATTYSNSEFQDILVYFTHSIFGQNTEEEIAWDLAKNCIARLGFEDCVVYFVDETRQLLIQKAAYGPKNPREFEIASPITIPIGQGITGNAALFAQSELVGDTSLDDRYIVDDDRRNSEITVPIIVDGQVFGVIDCEHTLKHFFTVQHLKILEAIASICAIKISKVRAERVAKEKEQHLFNIQKELLALKFQALKSHMNPHFLFNAINAIQYFITVGEKKSALLFLTTFSKMIRYYLNYFEKENVMMGDEIQLMRGYLELQKMRYTHKFDYQLNSQVTGYQATLKIPSMVLGPFIENVLESSVFDNENTGKVKVRIRHEKEKFCVTVLHNISENSGTNRWVNYRKDIRSWEEQVDLLNRLRNLGIEKQTIRRMNVGKTSYIERIDMVLPVTEER